MPVMSGRRGQEEGDRDLGRGQRPGEEAERHRVLRSARRCADTHTHVHVLR